MQQSNAKTMDMDIKISFIETPITLQEIDRVQSNIPINENWNKISENPTCRCYEIDIKDFIPEEELPVKKPTFGCVFSDQVAMNVSLLRPALYIHTDLGLANDKEVFASMYMKVVKGLSSPLNNLDTFGS